jgi:hypothetical protein
MFHNVSRHSGDDLSISFDIPLMLPTFFDILRSHESFRQVKFSSNLSVRYGADRSRFCGDPTKHWDGFGYGGEMDEQWITRPVFVGDGRDLANASSDINKECLKLPRAGRFLGCRRDTQKLAEVAEGIIHSIRLLVDGSTEYPRRGDEGSGCLNTDDVLLVICEVRLRTRCIGAGCTQLPGGGRCFPRWRRRRRQGGCGVQWCRRRSCV